MHFRYAFDLFESLVHSTALQRQFSEEHPGDGLNESGRLILDSLRTEMAILDGPSAWVLWDTNKRHEYLPKRAAGGQYAPDDRKDEARCRLEKLRRPIWDRLLALLRAVLQVRLLELPREGAGEIRDVLSRIEAAGPGAELEPWWSEPSPDPGAAAFAFHHWHVLPATACSKTLDDFIRPGLVNRHPPLLARLQLEQVDLIQRFIDSNEAVIHCKEGSYTTLFDTMRALGHDPLVTSILGRGTGKGFHHVDVARDSAAALCHALEQGGVTVRVSHVWGDDRPTVEMMLRAPSPIGTVALREFLSDRRFSRLLVRDRGRRRPRDREAERQVPLLHPGVVQLDFRSRGTFESFFKEVRWQLARTYLQCRSSIQGS